MRNDVLMMARVRNEERWIQRNLERTFQVARSVVLWDDGSTDGTEGRVIKFLGGGHSIFTRDARSLGWIWMSDDKTFELHYLRSPFRPAKNELFEVSEIRDKNMLWEYVKAQCTFKHVLCVDGDEMLSLAAIRHFDEAVANLEWGADMIAIPFVYLWNDERTQRVDGIYGKAADDLARLRFPRLFTIMRVDPYDLFEMRFAWMGHRQGRKVLGGFHCGSVPQENFVPKTSGPVFPYPIIHFGYMDRSERQRKFEWYNKIDPGNQFEGEYKHMIEVPNIHAPKPTTLVPYEDK